MKPLYLFIASVCLAALALGIYAWTVDGAPEPLIAAAIITTAAAAAFATGELRYRHRRNTN